MKNVKDVSTRLKWTDKPSPNKQIANAKSFKTLMDKPTPSQKMMMDQSKKKVGSKLHQCGMDAV